MSILEALKKLITKKGVTANGSNIAEVISNYADAEIPSGGSGLQVTGITDGTLVTMDKTWEEIRDALEAGKLVTFKHDSNTTTYYRVFTINSVNCSSGTYTVNVVGNGANESYTASGADEYPSYSYD